MDGSYHVIDPGVRACLPAPVPTEGGAEAQGGVLLIFTVDPSQIVTQNFMGATTIE
jgi:hypothetical protein